jgi:ATP-dependent RNA helicase RhlB
LHIEELDMVVNYDLPEYSENYVHRIGRTARAGRSGKAVALACEEYVFALEGIEEFIRMSIPAVTATGEMYVDDASAGMRVGHYLGQRGRDDRRGRSGERGGPRVAANRGAGNGERRTPALATAAVDGGDQVRAGAAAARERTAAPRDTGGRGEARTSAVTAASGSRRAAGGPGGTAPGPATDDGQRGRRDTGPREATQRPRRTRAGSGVRNGTGTESASGAAASTTRPRHAGAGDESGRRQSESGGGASRSHSTEERLAYYREKYGEDFKLAQEPAPVSPASRTDVSKNGDQQPASGLRRALPWLFRRGTSQRST